MFTGPDGTFRIDNVPAGTYTLVVEHVDIYVPVMDIVVADSLVDLAPIAIGNCTPTSCTAGQACVTALPGVCATGITECNGGVQTCVPATAPGTVAEACDGLDNDCDGQTDEGIDFATDVNNCGACGVVCGGGACVNGSCQQPQLCVPGSVRSCYSGPAGTENVGACSSGTQNCNASGSGYGACIGEVQPVAEVCDGNDNDCDGAIDEGAGSIFYRDADGDGHGLATSTVVACQRPAGFAFTSDDCDDTNANRHPGALEVCDLVDNNCNFQIDEGNLCAPLPNSTTACQNGACGIQACLTGFGNCDGSISNGCEVNVRNDINNCGGCNLVCPNGPNAFPTCSNALCGVVCNAGFRNCDGDPANGCEVLGNVCPDLNDNTWKQWQ